MKIIQKRTSTMENFISSVKKIGNSYFVGIPKSFADMYNWDENTVVAIDIDSGNMILSKLSQTDNEYKRRAGIPFDDDKNMSIEKSN